MRPDAAGLSNTDGMRRMIRHWVGMPEPVAMKDTGSDGIMQSLCPVAERGGHSLLHDVEALVRLDHGQRHPGRLHR
jgi:hypothetical protein